MIDLKDLKAKAEAATPGPWDFSDKNSSHFEVTSTFSGAKEQYWIADCTCQRNTEYIASANPATVLTLLECLDRAIETMRFAQNYSEVEYREGEKGYQFAIYMREALAEIRSKVGC